MKGPAPCRCLIWAVICCAVLALPGGSPAPLVAQMPACPPCDGTDKGIVSGPCCQPDMPGPCGSSVPGGNLTCRCRAGNLAFVSPRPPGTPTWQISSCYPAKVLVLATYYSPNLFHPPESN